MTKALISFGVGDLREYIEISRPFFEAYAFRHGYDYLEYESVPKCRPPSWFKVPKLRAALDKYDEALWIDADVVIMDGSIDIAAQVPPEAWQAIVKHYFHNLGEVPNSGIWFCRKPMQPYLDTIYAMSDFREYQWWEQSALMELLGYDADARPTIFHGPTELYRHTHFLPLEWNSHCYEAVERPRFMHALGHSWRNRIGMMRAWAAKAEKGWMADEAG